MTICFKDTVYKRRVPLDEVLYKSTVTSVLQPVATCCQSPLSP